MLKDICQITNNDQADNFVGLKFNNGKPVVIFPRGYRISDNDKDIRRDILRLINTIAKFKDKYEGRAARADIEVTTLDMPIKSYQFIIYDFLANGYYVEKETQYVNSLKGKINWKKTIQNVTPQINNGNIVYLDFVTKVNKINENNMLTIIHEYCVYESFQQLGWLFLESDMLPKKPRLKLNKNAFLCILKQALNNTFNDQKRMLFQSMINIISNANEKVGDFHCDAFGVYHFEYIWQDLIDHVFGEDNKSIYFPHAKWHILKGKNYVTKSSALEPDTIIKLNDKIYIIDAKYYKYGINNNSSDLPASSSIEKQIVYGEYIEQRFSIDNKRIYNAFVIPFESKDVNKNYEFAAVATGDWRAQTKNYEYVPAVLLDTRHIINTYSKHNSSEIEELTALIEKELAAYLKAINNK